ncbi:MAG TPA: AI-2E family transporter [Chloroflexia bacterium]|jgi:predicted PurR-regulated permease PerM|nr:AI-2E family transporter [Chloroflexia bacterium]
MNNNRWLQALIILLVIIAATWIMGQVWMLLIQFASIILLFFLAWLLAFALSPLARRLQAWGVGQLLAITVVYLAMLLLLTVIGFLVFPALADQIQRLIDQTPAYTAELEDLGNESLKQMQNWGVRVEDIHLDPLYGAVGEQVKNVGGSVLNFVTGLAAFLFNAIITLLLSFYFMKDGDRLFNNLVVQLPPSLAGEVQLLGTSIARAFGGFLRGQMVFALLYAVLNAGIMGAFNLDYVLVASIVAGLAMVVPLVGGLLAIVPPVLVALVTPRAADKWWILLIILVVVQAVMIQVVSPRIMSQAIGMHPLFTVAALLIGLQVAGPWGALFGIPVAGVIHQVSGPYFARLRTFFNVPTPDEPALALHGTVPVTTVSPPLPPPGPAPPAPEPVFVVPAPPGPPPNPQAINLIVLARGLSRRVLAGRRRARP